MKGKVGGSIGRTFWISFFRYWTPFFERKKVVYWDGSQTTPQKNLSNQILTWSHIRRRHRYYSNFMLKVQVVWLIFKLQMKWKLIHICTLSLLSDSLTHQPALYAYPIWSLSPGVRFFFKRQVKIFIWEISPRLLSLFRSL